MHMRLNMRRRIRLRYEKEDTPQICRMLRILAAGLEASLVRQCLVQFVSVWVGLGVSLAYNMLPILAAGLQAEVLKKTEIMKL